MRKMWVVGAAAGVVALAGGYAYADAQDLVPGWITAAPPDVPQPPFLTASPVAGSAVELGLGPLDPDAPRPDAATVQALAQAVRDDARTGSSTNIAVVDYLDGGVYADLGAAEPQVPASTTKILTAVAAVGALGPDFRMRTTVTWDAATSTLTLVAAGDVMLGADAGHGGDVAPGVDAAQGWAGVGDLADQVVDSLGSGGAGGDDAGGAALSAVRVAVDDSAFPGPAWPAEWPRYAFTQGFAAPVTGLAVNAGRLEEGNYVPRAEDPSLHAGRLFAEALAERGVTVRGSVTRASSTGEEVASVDSAPLAEVARHLLAVSDNTVSEAVARVLALESGRRATPAGEVRAMRDSLVELGVDVAGLELFEAAGYSERNRIAPATLTSALRVAGDTPELRGFLDWLPLAGLEGTVSTRYADTPAAGFWRAKTGSLTGVTTIAGVLVTADGRALAVAIMADGMPFGQTAPQAAFDAFLVALAECGCAA